MDFSIVFITKDENGEIDSTLPLVEKLGQPDIDMLDLLREETPGLEELDCSYILVDSGCPINGNMLHVGLSEEFARKTKLFTGKTTTEVAVPEAFFSRFIKFKTKLEFNNDLVTPATTAFFGHITTKAAVYEQKIIRARIRYVYETEEILDAWQEAGCPKKRGF